MGSYGGRAFRLIAEVRELIRAEELENLELVEVNTNKTTKTEAKETK